MHVDLIGHVSTVERRALKRLQGLELLHRGRRERDAYRAVGGRKASVCRQIHEIAVSRRMFGVHHHRKGSHLGVHCPHLGQHGRLNLAQVGRVQHAGDLRVGETDTRVGDVARVSGGSAARSPSSPGGAASSSGCPGDASAARLSAASTASAASAARIGSASAASRSPGLTASTGSPASGASDSAASTHRTRVFVI
jgi:hypothetical protein